MATTGLAQASSIVVPGVPTSTPSVVRLAAIEPGKASTPSVVALGDPVPAVTDEKVAAIPQTAGQRHAQAPTIIRGGILGGASATPAVTASAKSTEPAAATPADGAAAAAPNGDTQATDNKGVATENVPDGQAQPKAQPQEAPTLPRFSKAM